MSTTSTLTRIPHQTNLAPIDDERRQPMGLADTDACRECRGPVLRTDTPGLCWSCMPAAS